MDKLRCPVLTLHGERDDLQQYSLSFSEHTLLGGANP
jgi:hypothetical protein